MKFTKPALTIPQQAALLAQRGMLGDHETMCRRLASVNYYRLAAYWHTFRGPNGEDFLPGTDFEVVWSRYLFDRKLRLLAMDALERMEVATRTQLALAHAQSTGPFGYSTDPNAIYRSNPAKRQEFLGRLDEEIRRSHEDFIKHFRKKYGDSHERPPIWAATELLSFGAVLSLYKGSGNAIQKVVGDHFGVPGRVLESWLMALNVVRNICAHHGRLWNRELGIKPKLPRPEISTDWYTPVPVPPSHIFGALTILAHVMHRLAPGSGWALRVRDLLASTSDIPLVQMGFPPDWQRCPIWGRMLELEER